MKVLYEKSKRLIVKMTQAQYKTLQSVMWDYNISENEMESLISGKTLKAGHYSIESLFIKIASGLPWFSVLEIFGAEKVKELLTDEVIKKIWPYSIQKKYNYVRKRLHEALPDSK